jgi:hypothetical protein
MARPEDWIDQTVIIGTDMYGGDSRIAPVLAP